jgi:O-acetylhomoserine/O-acetylserine sulfhydrylase-like pyridoxal-dependent enzyme
VRDDDEPATDHRTPRGFSTRAIQAASRVPRVDQRPSSVPIYQTATFTSADAEELGDVLADPRAGYAYARVSNPTSSALAAAYADLASGEAGVALASGMGAIHAVLSSQLKAGDRVVAPNAVYGSTRTQLLGTFANFGVRVDFVDMTDNAAAAAAIAAAPTRVVYAETIANPTTVVTNTSLSYKIVIVVKQ